MSEGKIFPADPETYIISDDKLYVFYNGKNGNTKPQWEVDPASLQANADAQWASDELVVIYPNLEY